MITLNARSLQTANIITSSNQHDSSTPKELHTVKLARRDGEKLIYFNYATKEIIIPGTITCDDAVTFENFLDQFKADFTVNNGKLVLSYGGGYRLYYVDTEYISLPRVAYNITHCPFEIHLKALGVPFGLECDVDGNPILTNAYSKTTQNDIETATVDLLGSAPPKPRIKMTVDVAGDATSLDFINQTTGQQVTITPASLVNGDVIAIDSDALKATQNGEEINFTGSIPEFLIGNNDIAFDVYASTGTTLDASQTTNNAKKPFWGTRKVAQSFVLSVNSAIPKLAIILSKIGAPAGDITVSIQTDSAGSPSGTPVTNGTLTIPAAAIANNPLWIQEVFALMPSLSTGTTYWLVLSTTGGDVDNFYQWHYNNTGGYASGAAKVYVSSWAAIASSDFCFKIYKTTVDQSNANSADDSVTEPFTSSANKATEAIDQQQTTATSDFNFGNASSGFIDQEIITGQAGIISKITTKLKKVGSPGGNVVIDVYTAVYNGGDNAYHATALLATSTTVIAPGTITTSLVDYDFNIYVPSQAAGTHLIIRVRATSGADASNYYTLQVSHSSTGVALSAYNYYTYVFRAADADKIYFKEYYTVTTTASWDTAAGKLKLPPGPTVDSYAESNQQYNENFSSSATEKGQSFACGSNATLTSARAYIKKGGNPSGNIVAKIYAHTGTFGTSSLPTGAALATSDAIAISSLTTNYQLIPFIFSGANQISLVSGTKYVLVISYPSSSGGDYLILGSDHTSPTHGGNASFNTGGWAYDAGIDLCFYINGLYDTANNVAQSLALDAGQSLIAAATITETATKPTGTSTAIQVSGDGTNFENVSSGVEHVMTNLGSALKFKETLTGTSAATPEVDTLVIAYKAATILNAAANITAQSFTPGYTAQLSRLVLNIAKVGTPGDLVVRICPDNGSGAPNLAGALATQNVTAAQIATSFGWIPVTFSSPASLTASTTYWIVITAASADASNHYFVRTRPGNLYAGTLKVSTNSGGAYTTYTDEDILFITYRGTSNIPTIELSLDYTKRYL